jgi:hypothetical protein
MQPLGENTISTEESLLRLLRLECAMQRLTYEYVLSDYTRQTIHEIIAGKRDDQVLAYAEATQPKEP